MFDDAAAYLEAANASLAERRPGIPAEPALLLGHPLQYYEKYDNPACLFVKDWHIVIASFTDGTVRACAYHDDAPHVVHASGAVAISYVPLVEQLVGPPGERLVCRVAELSENTLGLCIGSWDHSAGRFASLSYAIMLSFRLDAEQAAQVFQANSAREVRGLRDMVDHITTLIRFGARMAPKPPSSDPE